MYTYDLGGSQIEDILGGLVEDVSSTIESYLPFVIAWIQDEIFALASGR